MINLAKNFQGPQQVDDCEVSIRIFKFTECKNNQFQKNVVMKNINVRIYTTLVSIFLEQSLISNKFPEDTTQFVLL